MAKKKASPFEALLAPIKADYEAKHEALMAEAKVRGEAAVKAMVAAFFDAHPDAEAIRWEQYTPHWNDGEACTFSVREPDVKLRGQDGGGGDDDGWLYAYNDAIYKKPLGNALNELGDALESVEDMLQIALGDHARVIVTREAITVEAYEHE